MLDDVDGENGLEQMNALVHFYFKEEPKTMNRLALLWGRLMFVLDFKGELTTKEINVG